MSRDTLFEQISIVESFTATNAMVYAQKCEVVEVSPTKPAKLWQWMCTKISSSRVCGLSIVLYVILLNRGSIIIRST